MTKTKVIRILLVINCLANPVVEASFFEENKTGWHWYQDPVILQEEVPHGTTQNQNANLSATEIVEDYKKELEHRLHTALVEPSFKNVKAYQELQKDMMDKAEHFSEMWMQVLYNNPYLDHTLITPVNHKSRHLYFDQKKQRTAKTIQDLSNEYGLFFIFDSHCSYCREFSPIVKLFSKTYNWEVIPITADGGNLSEFPRPLDDNGIIEKWKIKAFPALFAVNPNTEEVIPIAYGMTSLDEIESRIMLLTSLPGVKQ